MYYRFFFSCLWRRAGGVDIFSVRDVQARSQPLAPSGPRSKALTLLSLVACSQRSSMMRRITRRLQQAQAQHSAFTPLTSFTRPLVQGRWSLSSSSCKHAFPSTKSANSVSEWCGANARAQHAGATIAPGSPTCSAIKFNRHLTAALCRRSLSGSPSSTL